MQEIINEANKLLLWLFDRRIQDWAQVIKDNFGENEVDKYILQSTKAAQKYSSINGVVPIGAVAMNFSQAVKECFDLILPSHIGPVIQTLKDSGKVIQLGRGKGKVIVIINALQLGPSTLVKGVDPTNATELAKAVSATGNDIVILKEQNEILRKELEFTKETVARLQSENNLRYRITWT